MWAGAREERLHHNLQDVLPWTLSQSLEVAHIDRRAGTPGRCHQGHLPSSR